MEIEEMKVGFHKKVALKEVFPISTRYAFRKSLALACVLLPFFAICAFSGMQAQMAPLERKILGWAQIGSAALLAATYLKAELYRLSFNYEMEGLRFVISRGIVIKKIGSLPLLPVTEIYIQRGFIDVLCGLANVDIFTPMDTTRQFARIEALSPRDAHQLQCFLGDLLATQVFFNPAATESAERERASATVRSRKDTEEVTVFELPLPADDMPVDWKRSGRNQKGNSQGALRLL